MLSSESPNAEVGFVNSHPNPTGLSGKRTWWPSAASCAFVASGLEILDFGLWLYLRAWAATREHAAPVSGLLPIPLVIVVIGIAAQAGALWGIARRQHAVAP